MLVLVTYDVSTLTAAGGESLPELWATGTELGVRMPSGCGDAGNSGGCVAG